MLVTIGLVVVLVFVLVMLGRNNDGCTIDRTLEVIEIDEDDTQTLRRLISPHR